MGTPALIPGLHRATASQMHAGHRALKMIRPICSICASNTEVAGWGWWNDCPHDPYVGERGEVIVTKEYEDELDDAGKPTGNRVVKGETSKTVLRPFPNFVPVALTQRIESGRGPEYKYELFGFIYPKELRSPAFPDGIAPMCEFRECYSQKNLKKYEHGTFCQEAESIVVYEDVMGTVVEVANAQVRTDQWELARSKVRLVQ